MSIPTRISVEYGHQCVLYARGTLELVIEVGVNTHRVIYIAHDDKHIGIVSQNDSELLQVFDRLKVPTRMTKSSPLVTFDGKTPKQLQLWATSADMESADLICALLLMEIGVDKVIPKVSVDRVLEKVPSLTWGYSKYRTPEIK